MNTCITCLPSSDSNGNNATRIYNEKAAGLYNCVNITYTTANIFDPESLVIRLDGITLDPDQYTINAGNNSFTLIIEPNDINALNSPLDPGECLRVDYSLSSSGTNTSNQCISFI